MSNFTSEIQPILRLKQFYVTKLSFQLKEEHWGNFSITNNTLFQFSFSPHQPKNKENNLFYLLFNTSLKNEDESFNLEMNFVSEFQCEGIILEDLLNNSFVRINAPAIIFPYIRAFITNHLINSGFSPVYLPTFNFQNIKNNGI